MKSPRGAIRKHARKVKPKKVGKGGQVHVKGHTRTPRGNNAGKKPVHVVGYQRRKPRGK